MTNLSANATKVLNAIRHRGAEGATCEEVEQLTRLPHQTASARVNQLMNIEPPLVKASGRYRTNTRNRRCIVWVATENG